MKIAFISTYIPRKCGIGTFTNNLLNSVLKETKEQEKTNTSFIVAQTITTSRTNTPKKLN